MRIEELTSGQSVVLCAVLGDQEMEFSTTIEDSYPKKHMVLAAPVIKDEKVLTFRAKGLIINLLVTPPDSAPLIFKKVVMGLVKKPDGSISYTLSCPTEAKMNNRRESFRCYVGIESAVQCGGHKSAHDSIIRDVSLTGFSIVISDPELSFKENQVVHVVLNDTIDELGESFNFHLYGIIVRIQELENGSMLYGCRLNTKVPNLEAYIVKKERIRIRKANNVERPRP